MIRLAFVLVVLAQTGQPPVDPTVKPTGFVKDCTTSGCHAKIVDAQWLHGPTAAGACTACHKVDNEQNHTFNLVGNDKQMCGFCHVAETAGGLYVHNPVKQGQCLVCHNPHGANNRSLQRAGSIRAQCLTCHKGVLFEGKHLHTPVANDPCTTCHLPHSSSYQYLLSEPNNTICLKCHQGVMREVLSSTMASVGEVMVPTAMLGADFTKIHAPVLRGCTSCHATHASDVQPLLRKEPAELCGDCHKEVFQHASAAKVPHLVVTHGKACLNCHTPHGSPIGSLLKDNPINVCLECHSEPLQRPDGTPVGALHNVENAKYKHGAVRLGRCRECHEVHGSEHRSLLVHQYTPAFYQPFKLDEYALCFRCHDSSLVTEKTTTTATGFRNGSRNLHYVHVDSTEPPGRTCRACHATHASNFPKLLRESVPYGEWQIPIKYQQTPTGGSCAAGCHRARGYDRVNPVDNDGG